MRQVVWYPTGTSKSCSFSRSPCCVVRVGARESGVLIQHISVNRRFSTTRTAAIDLTINGASRTALKFVYAIDVGRFGAGAADLLNSSARGVSCCCSTSRSSAQVSVHPPHTAARPPSCRAHTRAPKTAVVSPLPYPRLQTLTCAPVCLRLQVDRAPSPWSC